jgi:hypothetical protein
MNVKRAIAVAILALLVVDIGVRAQSTGTTYNLQSSAVDPIDYGSYWNIFASDMYVVINGQPYYVSVVVHVFGDDTFGAEGTTHDISFWNLQTGVTVNELITGHIADDETQPVRNGPQILFTTLDGTFSGKFTGTIHIPIYAQEKCSRFCTVVHVQKGSTVILQ